MTVGVGTGSSLVVVSASWLTRPGISGVVTKVMAVGALLVIVNSTGSTTELDMESAEVVPRWFLVTDPKAGAGATGIGAVDAEGVPLASENSVAEAPPSKVLTPSASKVGLGKGGAGVRSGALVGRPPEVVADEVASVPAAMIGTVTDTTASASAGVVIGYV